MQCTIYKQLEFSFLGLAQKFILENIIWIEQEWNLCRYKKCVDKTSGVGFLKIGMKFELRANSVITPCQSVSL